jgi:hypothetical protein
VPDPAWWLILACILAFALVFAQARRPPVLDLGQQLDQVRLLEEALSAGASELRIDWTGPNKLGYLPLLVAFGLAPEGWVPRVALILLACGWLASVHRLAAIAKRPPASALVASTLLLGSSFYAGFFNFLLGIAGLAYWTWALRDEERDRSFGRVFVVSLGGVALFYLAHLLWLVVGGFAVATFVLLNRFRGREVAARALAVIVFAPLVLGGALALETGGWQSSSAMIVAPLERLTNAATATSIVFGGIRGPVEPLLFSALLLWIAFGLLRSVRSPEEPIHRFLLIAGAIFLACAFLLPDKVDKTIFFAWRWGAPGFVALVLAVPPPSRRARLLVGAAAILLLQLAVTARAWSEFDRFEMAGFDECLEALPEGARLFGADAQMESPRFRVSPFFQMLGYAGVERGAELNFSFGDYASSLVVRRVPRGESIRNDVLLRNPTLLRPAHLRGFTHLLLHASEASARAFEEKTDFLRRTAGGGDWHLLEIDAAALDRLLGVGDAQPIP